jgi:hypothetical protein
MNANINLVHLASLERASKTGATGDRPKEGAEVNDRLSALGNVVNTLASGDKTRRRGGVKMDHIPYRDSKLIRLLQESRGWQFAGLFNSSPSLQPGVVNTGGHGLLACR